MEIRGAKASELDEAAALQQLVFRPNEDALERYRTYVREDPVYQLDQTRVLILDGKMVGHLRVWDRLIRVRGAKIRAGGIGSVLIHPDYRGKGLAHALMRDTESYMTEAGYDVGQSYICQCIGKVKMKTNTALNDAYDQPSKDPKDIGDYGEQRHGHHARYDARNDEVAHGINSRDGQCVDLPRHLHRSKLRANARSGAACHHQCGEDRPQFLYHGQSDHD